MNNLFTSLIRVSRLRWQHTLESVRALQGQFVKLSLLCYPHLTRESCLASFHIGRRLIKLGRRSGWLFVALYCKNAQSALQTYYGGDCKTPIVLDFPISLSRAGIPRIIPPYIRKKLRRRDDNADLLVKWLLSLFSVGKMITCMPKISKKTFESIVTPLSSDQEASVSALCGIFKERLPDLIHRYLPYVNKLPLNLGVTWLPTWKSLPSYASVRFAKGNKGAFGKGKDFDVVTMPPRSPYLYWPLELKTFTDTMLFIHSRGESYSPLCLWPKTVLYALDRRNTFWCNRNLEVCEQTFAPHLPGSDLETRKYITGGNLASAPAGRGKRRIFAIGNYVQQRLLRPVHDWAMSLLRSIPTDGTFHQERPFDRLRGAEICYSYDLSAATDRTPLRVLFYVVEALFGHSMASAIVNSTLACQVFDIPFVGHQRSKLCCAFVVGQPLGMYSSWPLFALSHHFLVWLAAELVMPNRLFRDYALLGDDIIITNEAVARTYKDIMTGLGVKISSLKSLVSHKGAAEFAKRFRIKRLCKDLSPISINTVTGSCHPAGITSLIVQYPDLPFRKILRLAGAGFKVRNRARLRLPRKFARVDAIFTRYRLPLSFWFGRGVPISPHVAAELCRRFVDSLRPKDLKYPEVYLHNKEGQWNSSTFFEYSMFRGQMERWLRYLKWWTCLVRDMDDGLDPMEIIKKGLDCPVVITDWLVTKTDTELVRFGFLKRLYDFTGNLDPSWTLPLLMAPREKDKGLNGSDSTHE